MPAAELVAMAHYQTHRDYTDHATPAELLAVIATARRWLDDAEAAAVSAAVVDDGWSWARVGDALGVTKQAAHKRYATTANDYLRRSVREIPGQITTDEALRDAAAHELAEALADATGDDQADDEISSASEAPSAAGDELVTLPKRGSLAVECPSCGSEPGEPCRDPNGTYRYTRTDTANRGHRSRRSVAVRCPRCHARRGERCVNTDGNPSPQAHNERSEAGRAKGW